MVVTFDLIDETTGETVLSDVTWTVAAGVQTHRQKQPDEQGRFHPHRIDIHGRPRVSTPVVTKRWSFRASRASR